MKKLIYLFALVVVVSGCATLNPSRPSGQVTIQGTGSVDVTGFKTFTVASSAEPNTAAALRDMEILRSIAYRFEQEGLKYVENHEDAEILIVLSFLDKHGQRYIPPQYYTTISYDPGTTRTNTVGNLYNVGNFINYSGTTRSSSNATATATTRTTGGYFVPVYGIAIGLNIYKTADKSLLWSGTGTRNADLKNSNPAINDIIISLIDKSIVTPAYKSGERYEIRERYKDRFQNEYLMNRSSDGKTHVGVINKVDGATIMSNFILSRGRNGELLMLNLTIDNQSNKVIEIDPDKFKLTLNDEDLEVIAKSRIVEMAHQLRKDEGSNITTGQAFAAGGLVGGLVAAVYNSASNNAIARSNEEVDKLVQSAFNNYLDKIEIEPNNQYYSYAYVGGFNYVPDGAKIKLMIPIFDDTIDVDYEYVPNWTSVEAYQKLLRGE